MADYPRIQRGMGNLNPRVFNQVMAQLEDLSNPAQPSGPQFANGAARPFLAILTSATNLRTIDGYTSQPYGFNWLYEWHEVKLAWDLGSTACTTAGRRVTHLERRNPDGTKLRSGTIGTSPADCTAAVNIVEIQNSSDSRIVGPGMQLPDNTDVLPIGTDANSSPPAQVVLMHSFSFTRGVDPLTGSEGCTEVDTFYAFWQDNPLQCSTSSFRSSTFNFDNDLGSDWGVLRDYDVDLGAFT